MKVQIVTLGCARNETDSEELAGRLAAADIGLVDDEDDADLVLVNTCGFIDAAKKDSIDVILAAGKPVVAVGCLAERYGAQLAAELPDVTVWGFDAYPGIADRLRELAGEQPPRRPARKLELATPIVQPESTFARELLRHSRSAPLKIATGCDRRCTFCAIPGIRGRFHSRPIAEVVAEARWLAAQGIAEVVLVSENSTSYGKDLGPGEDLVALLRALEAVEGLAWVRVVYLQPAETRPQLIEQIANSRVPYFDLPFQHVSPAILKRMRRYGDTEQFLGLLAKIRAVNPRAGVRSNFIVGFPGETEAELELLAEFVNAAELDAIGIFGYSDEEGTEAHALDGKLPQGEINARVDWLADITEEAVAQRAERRVGERVEVLIDYDGSARAAHQGDDDGSTTIENPMPGTLGCAIVTANEGVDLLARMITR
ncbi:MAG: MiaB/RimO family radical SAM methylthiotransferase [Propionibacteriaceae bacterium]|nr:MiaB/RimO family radical SAM methylthiotransferase [Propionibacteriaceae bacterium]